ncbi:2-succinyl-5-enolpyruvyl-6-hydroxy-3-cyclohexene-1-carboxylic-acid synthase [Altericista sp. CCNU0014]|uniref:2-succinyl-5-enolpyruvyl-6-hydroxy-3- cyclohexene-1-carboxylic-acid synthase n=1 Tax=Altericista sp. CCNU0014 TaxID=3082949 RepID=UPI003850AFC3
MPLDFRNTNTLWASILAETLHRLGLQTAIICPGSRSASLAVAFAQHPHIESIPILDERSAAFFALGLARRSSIPVALICTSGTAGANFYPAVIEAQESHVPLLLLTADRPPELRHCHAGQAIDQIHLYGTYPNWYTELALPETNPPLLAYLRQTIVQAWERSQFPVPGPVHLNIPLREPLEPIPDPTLDPIARQFDEAQFFQMVKPRSLTVGNAQLPPDALPLQTWLSCDRGLIVAGPAIPHDAVVYCKAIAQLSQTLGWPVLAEGLSPLRNHVALNPHLISTYDIALRNPDVTAQLQPAQIIRIGELPTSKTLRQWLQTLPIPQWIVEPSDRNVDPLHSHSVHLRTSIEAIAECLKQSGDRVTLEAIAPTPSPSSPSPYLKSWLDLETRLQKSLHRTLSATQPLRESKVAWLLSQTLPLGTPLFIANSMPVRDVELFWQPGNLNVQPYFNRGANGIDGTLSSALGMVHRHRSSVLLTGDLSLLHDTNGFLIRPHWQGHLTVVLINNAGGGIFGMLPIAQFEPPFETFFATPQQADFAELCAAYGVEHIQIQSWEALETLLNPLPAEGIRVLEIGCDRALDAEWRRETLHRLSVESFYDIVSETNNAANG